MPLLNFVTPSPEAQREWERYILSVRETLTPLQRKENEQAQTYLNMKCMITESSITSRTWQNEDTRFHMHFGNGGRISVVDKISGAMVIGKMHELQKLIKTLNKSRLPSTSPMCQPCNRHHRKFGMEIEFLLFSGDNTYKEIFLRKVNNKKEMNHSTESIGLDGSGRPIEVRNVNGDTPQELHKNLLVKLSQVQKAYSWVRANLPNVSPEVDLRTCGTHIHFFHPGIPRSRVNATFTAIAMAVNDFDPTSWISRLQNNYGIPFAIRSAEWCRSEYASELRVLNSVHPDVILKVVETLEEVLSTNSGSADHDGLHRFVDKYNGANVPTQPRSTLEDRLTSALGASPRTQNYRPSRHYYLDHNNEALAYFIKSNVIKFTQIKRLVRWLQGHYQHLSDVIVEDKKGG